MRTVADKRQLNLYPDRTALNRLEQIATKFGRPRTQIAVDILETYMDMWVLAEEAKMRVVKEQQERLTDYIKGKTNLTDLPKALTEAGAQGRKRAR